MKLEISVISRDFVTPSSPTPLHLINYKLSFLDQIAVPVLMPQVLFYPAASITNGNLISNPERSNHLKKSLSQALTLFYPLAGRLVGNSHVNCNDEGVPYVEAQANCNLFDVITDPNLEEINKLVRCDLDHDHARDLYCLVVQATFFCCGGLAIGLGTSHKVADAFSTFMFVNSWAALSRGDDHIQSPIFESAALFPPRDLGSPTINKPGNKENIVTKRFVFTAEKISILREMYSKSIKDEGFIRPTRIETLSAFIWTRFMVATGANRDTSKVYALRFTVDIRTRVDPPLSENHFGNYVFRTFAVHTPESNQDSRYDLVKKIRDAIRKVNPDYVAKIQERDDLMYSITINGPEEKESEGKVEIFGFSSLCRIPQYESDFGWGKPVSISAGKVPTSKVVFFVDSKYGGGIDALMNLDAEDMEMYDVIELVVEYCASNRIVYDSITVAKHWFEALGIGTRADYKMELCIAPSETV